MPRLTPGQMVALPWHWQGPAQHKDEQGNGWWEIRVAELPEFFVAAATHGEAVAEASAALEAFLDSYISCGESPPLPPLPRIPGVFAEGKDRDELEPYARVRELQVA